MPSPPPLIVVMGVSGASKSTIAELLAERLELRYVDADDLHPSSNIEKMAAGVPLTDDDRWPWLALVGDTLAAASTTGLVIACSALTRAYRDVIRHRAPSARFVLLDGSRELLQARLTTRDGHFMPASLLDSQLATLERLTSDEFGFTVSIDATPQMIVDEITGRLGD